MNMFWNLEWKLGKSSPTVAIKSNLCGLMIISLNFTCRDFNANLKQHAVF